MYRYQILIEYVGTPFIGWQIQKKGKSVQKIIGKINGLYPYPGAFFSFNGERYKILKAEKSSTTGKPGDIVSENFEVCCGEGSIKVLSIQREGKRVQQINEFLLGTQIKKGTNIA